MNNRAALLATWCGELLGARPRAVLFQVDHLSQVTGVQLDDGRQIVVKARPAQSRIAACLQVQRALLRRGFPAPEPLAGPVRAGSLMITAEALIDGGHILARNADAPRLSACGLAEFVRLAAGSVPAETLQPPPAWAWWDHGEPGTWPLPDDLDVDLNEMTGPAWVDEAASRARRRLRDFRAPDVIGHVDWEAQNLRWRGRTLHVVHDWDSAAARSEAVVAGLASAVFTATGKPGGASLAETTAFLTAYAEARGRPWAPAEQEACWAAGLWIRAFNAKKDSLRYASDPGTEQLREEVHERLRRAGA